MNSRSVIQLAVVIVMGLEQLSYSVAFERTGEFEFPFSIPFKDTFGVIHRSFPMQTKFITEILRLKPVLQEETKSEPDRISGNPSVKKQHEDPDPHVEATYITSEAKEIQSHNSKLKEVIPKVEENDSTKSSETMNSPEIYKEQEDDTQKKEDGDSHEEASEDPVGENKDPVKENKDSVEENKDSVEENKDSVEENKDSVEENKDSVEENKDPVKLTAVDSEGKEIETDSPKMRVTGGDSQETRKDSNEDEDKQEAGSFRYRLSLRIEGPGGRTVKHVKTGYLTSTPDRSFDVDVENIQYLMKDIVESGNEIKCVPLSDVISQNAEKKYGIQYSGLHIYSPNVGHSGQRMYHKGNLDRQKGFRPLNTSFRNHKPHKPMNVHQKQDEVNKNAEELKTTEASFSKEAIVESKLTEPRVYKYSPNIRYSSQRMDHKGNLYRYEDIRTMPIKYRNYYPYKPINIRQNQDDSDENVQEPKLPESFFAKEVTEETKPTEPDTTVDTFNEISQEKQNKAMIWNTVMSMDTPVFPFKFKSFNYNIKPRVLGIENKEGSSSIENNAWSYGSKETEAKRSVLLESEARSSNIKESDSERFDLKGTDSKEPDFDDDDTEEVKGTVSIQPQPKVFQHSVDIRSKEFEAKISDTRESGTKNSDSKNYGSKEPSFDENDTEDVKRIVVIQPQTKVFQHSVDIPSKKSKANISDTKDSLAKNSDSKSAEAKEPNFDEDDTESVKRISFIQPQTKVFHDSVDVPKQETFPVKSEVKLEEFPAKKDALPDRSQFYRQFLAPLGHTLLSKLFGRPAGLVIPP